MDDLIELAKDLIEHTKSDDLKWSEETSFGMTAYSASIGNFTATIKYHFDEDVEESYYIISLIDGSGTVVGSATRARIYKDYEILDRLYEVAVASARNLKKSISDVRSLLKKNKKQ